MNLGYLKRLANFHLGPGEHPSGSSQDVHGGNSTDGNKSSMSNHDKYSTAKEYISKEFKKVYHHSTKKIDAFENDREAWFTTNQYGYDRRAGSGVVNERYIPVNQMKWASDKDLGSAWNLSREEKAAFLKSKGFDGWKRSVDGETHYAVFDPANIHTESDLLDYFNRQSSKH